MGTGKECLLRTGGCVNVIGDQTIVKDGIAVVTDVDNSRIYSVW